MERVAIRRILAATDFSPASEGALRWASLLSQRFGADLVLLHALALDPALLLGPTGVTVDLYTRLVEHARQEAERLLRQLEERLPGARSMIREGPAREVILQATAETGADLVVMGTHGRSGIPRLLFGSVAQHVVVHSPVPVLTVRSTVTDTPQVRTVLVPVDFSPASDVALPWAELLARAFGGRIVLLHVVELTYEELSAFSEWAGGEPLLEAVLRAAEERAREELRTRAERLQGAEVLLHTAFGTATARHRIPEVAREVGADLVVMGTHGRTGVERILFGSVAEHVVRASPVPVLTVRHRAEAGSR
ncbi:MAG: universal stress protein [Armatimonadota bacterium]|nr:universal stress protein [Armatimonadota bacterium]MDR7445208.1 universal stress protein [Armatimonadota bacterium]MDR7613691.1 universal stress protein [Armatimonadota bacterium]